MFACIKRGGEGHDAWYKEFMIDSEDDVNSLPNTSNEPPMKTAPGSIAYTQDMKHMYMLGNDDTWREV